jgi:preprotein translocase subunit Sss1
MTKQGLIFMSKRYSTSYVFTADVNSKKDMDKISDIRATIKDYNVDAKRSNLKAKRVVLRGRKPAKKEFVRNFWTGESGVRSYDWAGNIVGGIKNATMIDVYIYDRY